MLDSTADGKEFGVDTKMVLISQLCSGNRVCKDLENRLPCDATLNTFPDRSLSSTKSRSATF